MGHLISVLICAGIGIIISFLWLFIKNYRKALQDPDVVLASKLGMSMPVFRDCQEVYEEYYAWRKDKGLQKEMLKPDYHYKKFPKNPNAFKKYESYMNYLYDIKEWETLDELGKKMMAFSNPYKKEEYAWIRRL